MPWKLVHEVGGRRKVRWVKALAIYVWEWWVVLPLIATLTGLILGDWPWPWEPDNHWLFWLTITGIGGVLVMLSVIWEQWHPKTPPWTKWNALVYEVDGRRKIRWGKVLVIYVLTWWVAASLFVITLDWAVFHDLPPKSAVESQYWLRGLAWWGVISVVVMAMMVREQWRAKDVPGALGGNHEHYGHNGTK